MASKTQNHPEFGKLRQILFPIHGYELQKFLPLAFIFTSVVFMYGILRTIKDTLVVNAPGAGAEVISYLKTMGTLPAAIIAMSIFVKLSGVMNRKTLFYTVTGFFGAFFMIFNAVLLPNIDTLHPTVFADQLQSILPAGMQGLVAMLRNWTYSAFYIMAELWGSLMLGVLFWGTANEVCKTTEAKRFYGFLLLVANLVGTNSGFFMKYANSFGNWNITMSIICNLTGAACLLIVASYWYLNEVVMHKPEFMVEKASSGAKKKKKAKLGFAESMKELSKSRYLLLIAVLVLSYGVAINLVEIAWKHNSKIFFAGDKQAFAEFQSMNISITNLITAILTFLGSSNIMRVFGWKVTALVTPVVLIITSALFFTGATFGQSLAGILATFGSTPLAMVVWVGLIQNSLTKGSKYAFFDFTKETAYIPLDENLRRTGKSAVDGVASRLGKSGGSFMNMGLLLALGSQDAVVPFLGFIVLGISGIWIMSAKELSGRYENLVNKSSDETSESKESAMSTTYTKPSKA